MKKVAVEQVRIQGYDFTGLIYSDQLPTATQKALEIPDGMVMYVTGEFRPEFAVNSIFIDLQGITTNYGSVTLDLMETVDQEALIDVILTKGDIAAWHEDYEAYQILRKGY